MSEDRTGGISSFGVGFGDNKGQQGEGGGDESSFRVAVVAEVVPGPDWATGRIPPLDPIAIDAQTFDQVMGQLAPTFAIDVDDPFGGDDPPLRVELVWRERKAMRPSEIVEHVPALRALVDARRVVQDVATSKITADQARAQLGRILPRPSWAEALVSEVRTAPAARAAAPREAPVAAPPSAPAPAKNGGSKGGLDALLDMVDVGGEPPPASVQPSGGAGAGGMDFARVVADVARSARPVKARAVVGSAPQRLEKAFRNLLDGILRHPEFRRLEATWRALRLLVEHCDAKAGVEVDVVPAGRAQVGDALRRLGEGDGERPPVDLVVIDQRIAPTAADLALLDGWAGLAETLLAPIVVAGHPAMLGADSLAPIARSTSQLSASDDPRAIATRAIAAHQTSRWVCVVLNDPLLRAPHTQDTARQKSPPFDEDPADVDAYVYGSGAYVVAALCARSHARLRWPTAIIGARDGVVQNLPVRTVHDRGVDAAIPLEAVPTEDVVREVAKAGLAMLSCAPNTDAAILTRAPVLHREGGGEKPAAGTLADQLFVGRFARAVQQVAAAIPHDTPAQKAEEVARIALADLFERAPPPGPTLDAKVDARGALTVTVHPRRFAGIGLEELTLGAALG